MTHMACNVRDLGQGGFFRVEKHRSEHAVCQPPELNEFVYFHSRIIS